MTICDHIFLLIQKFVANYYFRCIMLVMTFPLENYQKLIKIHFTPTEAVIILICLSKLDDRNLCTLAVVEIAELAGVSKPTFYRMVQKANLFCSLDKTKGRYDFTDILKRLEGVVL